MNFIFFDTSLMILFCIFVAFFIKIKRKNMKREGLMFLYRTQWGVKFIEKFSKKNQRILKILSPIIIVTGFFLMITMIYLFWSSLWQYIINPNIIKIIKAPPIAPLIPYFPKLFGMESFFPDFYFVHFIIAISLVALVHEFSHGIFMKLFKIRIKSTGFVFLGPILGAFVEQDDKQMVKRKNSEQMTVLGAGVFANLVTGLILFAIMIGFFFAFYSPSGYIFNTYSLTAINKTDITSMKDISGNLTEVLAKNQTFYLDNELKVQLNPNFSNKNLDYLVVYSGPSIVSGLKGAIIEINGKKIRSRGDLQMFMATTKPGEKILVKTKEKGKIMNFEIILGENPSNSSIGYLGIGSYSSKSKGLFSRVILFFVSFRDQNVLYEPVIFPEAIEFIYYLLWWCVVINLLVALFNMLPLGALDGGRFFYLSVLSVTKSEKIAKWSFKIATWILLGFFGLMMILWFIRII